MIASEDWAILRKDLLASRNDFVVYLLPRFEPGDDTTEVTENRIVVGITGHSHRPKECERGILSALRRELELR
jgi:hypothetical protein